MNRHYSTAFFAELLADIRLRQPDAAIGLDIISGFPGETSVQFQTSCRLLEQLPFTHLHVFPFSRRPGTPAAELPNQLTGDLIKERAAQLRQIGERKLLDFFSRHVGQRLEVVFEGGDTNGLRKGLSQNYLTVWGNAESFAPGECRQVKIVGQAATGLLADPAAELQQAR
jgi:threonylcarbamoyladenosine tRNA methylthiotransferase MtaB